MGLIKVKDFEDMTLTEVHEIATQLGITHTEGFKQGFCTSLELKPVDGLTVTIKSDKYKDVKMNLIECISKANAIRFLNSD